MNTQAFVFWLNKQGKWVIEAERIYAGLVTEQQVIDDYQSGIEDPELNRDAHRVFLLPVTHEPSDV